MKKKRTVPVMVGALVALGIAGYALGASAAVTLKATGPEPNSLTINWGDTVTYSNSDSVEHAISIPRAEVTSPAIPPGATFEHVFDKRGGNYNFVQQGKRNHSGQVVVRVDGTVTLKSGLEVVPYGKSVLLSGQSSFPGTPVLVRGREAGAGGEWKTVLELNAATDGSFTGRLRPTIGGRYQARIAADQIASKMVDVAVRPKITIAVSKRTAPVGTSILVTGKISPGGAVDRADLAGYDTRRKRWIPLLSKAVPASGKVRFRSKVEEGSTRLRISIRGGSTEAGYTTAESRFVRVVGTVKK